MALTCDNRRVTRDIDTIFANSGIEFSIIHEMVVEHGLPVHWPNTAACPYMPSDDRLVTTLENTGLTISTASSRHMFVHENGGLSYSRPEGSSVTVRRQ